MNGEKSTPTDHRPRAKELGWDLWPNWAHSTEI